MPSPGRPLVIADIVEEHFDEADFLCEHREDNVFTDDWDLGDLRQCEERADAHLDGLRLAGLFGVELAQERLLSGRSAALAATLVLADAHGAAWAGSTVWAPIVDALRTADAPIVDGIRLSLRHRPALHGVLGNALQELVLHDDAMRAAAATDVLAFWGQKVDRRGVERLLTEAVPNVRALAFAVAGRTGTLTEAQVQAAMADADPAVRGAALAWGMHVGARGLAALVLAAATRNTDPDPEAVRALGVLGEPASESVLQSLLARLDLQVAAVQALGRLGRTGSVPRLLEAMADDALGVHAVAAYRRITGATDVEGEQPLVPHAADEAAGTPALPPDPQKAAADWQRRAKTLTADASWQCGIAIGAALPALFDRLPLSVRRDVYLRLRAQRAAVPAIELEALAARQRRPAGA